MQDFFQFGSGKKSCFSKSQADSFDLGYTGHVGSDTIKLGVAGFQFGNFSGIGFSKPNCRFLFWLIRRYAIGMSNEKSGASMGIAGRSWFAEVNSSRTRQIKQTN